MRISVLSGLLGFGLWATSPGCGSPALDRVPDGSWGGDHVSLSVSTSSATVEFDCAHGLIEGPLVLDASGRFSVAGKFAKEHGGPILEGEVEDVHPALYEGATDGRTLTFTVRITDLGETRGPFVAVRGATPRVIKCL
jgi:hypothetical protein